MDRKLEIVMTDALRFYIRHLAGCIRGNNDPRAVAALYAQRDAAQLALKCLLKKLTLGGNNDVYN
jgi:hypothetical protein